MKSSCLQYLESVTYLCVIIWQLGPCTFLVLHLMAIAECQSEPLDMSVRSIQTLKPCFLRSLFRCITRDVVATLLSTVTDEDINIIITEQETTKSTMCEITTYVRVYWQNEKIL